MTNATDPTLFPPGDANLLLVRGALVVLLCLLGWMVILPALERWLDRRSGAGALDPAKERRGIRLTLAYVDDELWKLRLEAVTRPSIANFLRQRELKRDRKRLTDRLFELREPTGEAEAAR